MPFNIWLKFSQRMDIHKVVRPLEVQKIAWQMLGWVSFAFITQMLVQEHVQSLCIPLPSTFMSLHPCSSSFNSWWYQQQHMFQFFSHLNHQGLCDTKLMNMMDIWVHKLKSYEKLQLPRTHIITRMLVTLIEKQLTIFFKCNKNQHCLF
jgi:hypothetical protein